MNNHSQGRTSRRPRRSGGGSRQRPDARREYSAPRPPAKKSLWQKITAFFGNGSAKAKAPVAERSYNGASERRSEAPRTQRKPEAIPATTPRLYVGNLSFEASESDLFELFNGVGQVQNAEVVTYKHNQRSKGFAFVQMLTVEEAQRAVVELHDKEFLGRKLVVSGAKSSDRHDQD
jgi:RNA recognition motif-containing protein